MENRKYIILVLLGAFLFMYQSACAYETNTHGLLTQEAVRLYNQHNTEFNGATWAPFLIDGARREDDAPRWMNHFYDPVKNRGLSQDLAIDPLYQLGNWESSKEWAQDDTNQNKLTYSPVVSSILSLVETGKIQKFIPTSDFTWKKAQKYWIQGDKEMALFTLGHIIHLIQDASVPDHTRNDSHAEGSPYEAFSGQYTIENPDTNLLSQIKNINIEKKSSLADYFNGIALYSNNNFYSKDTIGIQSGYNLPQSEESEKIGSYIYEKTKDENGNTIYLVARKNLANYSYMIGNGSETTLKERSGNLIVLPNYWSLLSKKAVQYSAGVIDLFMKEVELHKNDPEYATKEKPSFLAQVASFAKNTVSSVQRTMRSIFGGEDDSFSSIQEIPLNNKNPETNTTLEEKSPHKETPVDSEVKNPTPPESIPKSVALDDEKSIQTTALLKTDTATSTAKEETKKEESTKTKTTKAEKTTPPLCAIPTYKNPTNGPLIFNELAWMGTTKSGTNEWIELKNIDSYPVSIAGWTLRNKSKSINISLADSKTKSINSKEFFLLERTDNTSAPASSNLIYTGALKNTDEELYLFDSFCNLIDYMSAQPTWRAGDAEEHRTMERDVNGYGWHTSSVVNGTPKKENSSPYTAPPKTASSTKTTTTKSNTTTPHTNTNNSSGTQTQHVVYTPPPLYTLRINEIMYNPTGNDTDQEWIEIQNNSSSTITLDSPPWKLREGETNHTISPYQGGNSITSGLYAILASDGQKFITDHATVSAPIFTTSFSLNNSGETLSLIYDTTAIDTITYTSTTGAQGDGNSLQYIDSVWKASVPTPGDANVFSLQTSTQEGTTTQATSTQETSTSTQATTTETATTSQNQTSDETTPANHLVISEVYPDKTGANADFIELYNPTEDSISLSSYALRILHENATDSVSLIDFTGESKQTIYAHGFYLIGFDNYAENGHYAADAHRGASIHSTQPETIVLTQTQNEDTQTIDTVTYNPENLQNNQSFERMANKENVCYAAIDAYELEGNACDTNTTNDFVVRATKNPQNTVSLLEPRTRPAPVQELSSTYHKDSVQVQLNWSDTNNVPENTHYNIYDISQTPRTWCASTTATTASVRIETLAKEYTFAVVAADAEGYESTEVTTNSTVPSFLSDVHFYNASNPVIELFYDSYPFIPSLHTDWTGDVGGRLVVPYLNSGPYYERYVERSPSAQNSGWSAEALHSIYPLRYIEGWGSEAHKELYLRDTGRFIVSGALSFDYVGNNKITLGTWMDATSPPPTFDANSYITFAFYDQSWDNTQFKTYSLIAVDPTKYYLTEEPH